MTANSDDEFASYTEGIDVLYTTNTIITITNRVILNVNRLVLPQRLASITSLELLWPLVEAEPRSDEWVLAKQQQFEDLLDTIPAVFPSLCKLYLSLPAMARHLLSIPTETWVAYILRPFDKFVNRNLRHNPELRISLPSKIVKRFVWMTRNEMCESTERTISVEHTGEIWRSSETQEFFTTETDRSTYPLPPAQVAESVANGRSVNGYWILACHREVFFPGKLKLAENLPLSLPDVAC